MPTLPAAISTVPLLSPATVTVRPIEPGDDAALRRAFPRLDVGEVDHVTCEALVAIAPGDGRIVAVAHYATPGPAGVADFAVAVEDAQQGRGLGTALGWRLLAAAASTGVHTVTASTPARNLPARALLRKLGFRPEGLDHGVIELALRLA